MQNAFRARKSERPFCWRQQRGRDEFKVIVQANILSIITTKRHARMFMSRPIYSLMLFRTIIRA